MPAQLPFPGAVYKFAESNGVGQDVVNSPSIDQQAMSATAVICTPVVDRQGEIIIPEGVDSTDWQKNPTILWEHGFDGQITTPIAKGIGPDGTVGLKLSDNSLEGTAWFTNKNPQSAQIFDLIVEGIIRAASIHVIPIETEQQRSDTQIVTVYPKSTLLEWSWGKIGVNPEAVLKVLNSGRLNSEPICALAKSFLFAHAPRAKGNGIGADFGKGKSMTPEEEAAAKKQAEAAAAAAAGAGGAGAATDDTPVEPGADDAESEAPPSVRVANAVHSSLSQLMANLEGASNTYEDPRAKEYFGGPFLEKCNELMTEVKGLIGELGGDDAEEPAEEEPAEEEAVKSWLASAPTKGLRLSGYLAPLNRIAKAKDVPETHKMAIQAVLKNLRGIIEGSRTNHDAAKEKVLQEQIAAATVNFGDAAKGLTAAAASLAEIIPVA